MARPLTAKQAAFVREYLIDLNASAAARRAGYSEKTAGRTGNENLQKPAIADAIEAALKDRAERTQLTADQVLENLHRIATGDDSYGQMNGLGDTIEQYPRYSDRLKAWELIGKHLGMFVERVDHTTKGEAMAAAQVHVYLPGNGRDESSE